MNRANITPVIQLLRIDHLSFFTHTQSIRLSCTAKQEEQLKQVQLKMSFEVFNNLLLSQGTTHQTSHICALIGERLSKRGARWEQISIKSSTGESLIFESIRLVETKSIKKSGEARSTVTGIIKAA